MAAEVDGDASQPDSPVDDITNQESRTCWVSGTQGVRREWQSARHSKSGKRGKRGESGTEDALIRGPSAASDGSYSVG
jgi:hypothetical protein